MPRSAYPIGTNLAQYFFHFNVNVLTNTGSIARMANNKESFARAMEIQERKREKIKEEQSK
jgi:hypothetical protein